MTSKNVYEGSTSKKNNFYRVKSFHSHLFKNTECPTASQTNEHNIYSFDKNISFLFNQN